MEVFSGGNRSASPPAKTSFQTGLSRNNIRPYGGLMSEGGPRVILLLKKPNYRDRNIAQYSGKQNNKWSSGVSSKQSSTSLSRKNYIRAQKNPRIHSRRVSNIFSLFTKKFVYRKIPKPALARRISSCQQELEKIDPRSRNFICSKVGTWYHS